MSRRAQKYLQDSYKHLLLRMRTLDWRDRFQGLIELAKIPLSSHSRWETEKPAFDLMEPRLLLDGQIGGTIFKDLNGDNIQQAGENGAPGIEVFLDANLDGVHQDTEQTQVIAGDGSYNFSGLDAGDYKVEVLSPQWERSIAASTITLSTDQERNNVDFGISATLGTDPKIQTGIVTVFPGWTTVELSETYDRMIVTATPIYDQTSDPLIVRIDNVTSNSFDIKVEFALDGDPSVQSTSGIIDVQFMAVEEGLYLIDEGVAADPNDDIYLEAYRFNSDLTARKSNWNQVHERTFGGIYTNPVILGQVMSSNDERPSTFFAYGDRRQDPIDPDNFFVGKTVSEDPDTTRDDEEIGYIVIQAGSSEGGDFEYEAGVSGRDFDGLRNNNGETFTRSSTTFDVDGVLLSLNGIDGVDGGWPVLVSQSGDQFRAGIHEDEYVDVDGHTDQNLSYIFFGQTTLIDDPVNLVIDKEGDEDNGDYTEGDLTLREAILLANNISGQNTITFDETIFDGDETISLGTIGELAITDDVVIEGVTESITLDGENSASIFDIDSASVDLSSFDLVNANGTNGGAINIDTGTLNLKDTSIRNSTADNGAGIYASGSTLTLENTSLDSNTATFDGGGLFATGGEITIDKSTISRNLANNGGGIRASGTTITITNATLSGNGSATSGGGINTDTSTVTMTNVTLTGNNAGTGGGIFNSTSTVTLNNTIIAGNTATSDNDISGTVSGQHNLVGDANSSGSLTHGIMSNIVGNSGSGIIAINNVLNTTLANNGGPTLTHALVSSSLAINAGSNTLAAGLSTDQTGASRITFASVDIGAVESPNVAPTDLELSNDTIAENSANGTQLGVVTVTDANASDSHTFSLSDTSIFAIDNNGTITVNDTAELDHETNDPHTVTITVSDSGGLTYDEAFVINITDVNEAPTDLELSNDTIAENSANGTQLGVVTVTDEDASESHTFSLSDTSIFAIDNNGTITVNDTTELDHETNDPHTVTITVSDSGGLTYDEAFVINITDVNEAPEDFSVEGNSVPENSAPGTAAATVTFTDPDDGDDVTYSIADNALFEIDEDTGVISVKDGAVPDHEDDDPFTVVVTGSDGILSTTRTVTISITDVNEAPQDLSVEGNSVPENSATGTTAGTVTFTDPDDGDDVTYSIADNALFEIDEDTGVITVKDGAVPDHETDDPFTVVVTGSDGILSTTGTVTISITDVNEAPEDFSVEGNSVAENSATGTPAGTVSFTDPDDGDDVTYSIANNALFEIDEDTGVITVKDGAVPDHETDDPFTVVVTGSDGILSTTGTVTISITDVNEAPEDFSVEGNTVAENSAPGTAAATVTFTDPDDGDDVTYSIANNALFEIDEDTGVITVKDGAVPDHETDDPFTVVVTGSDGILSTTGTVTISITDINEAPEDFSVEGNSVAENSGPGTPAATVTFTDPDDGDDVTYSIADNVLFEIDEDTGVITVKDGATPDHETDDPFTVVVTGSDGILSTTGTVTISITDVNEAPEDFSVEGNSVPENSATGTPAATVTFTDPDNGDDVTYSIADNALFEIDEDTGVITVKDGAVPDHETDDPFTVLVTGSDGILSTTGTVTISITDVNEAPEDFSVEGNSVAENSATGTPAGTVSFTDPDDGDDVTYSIADNALFEIDEDTGVITVKDGAVPDHEDDDPFTVVVTGSDGILSTTGTVTISITDVNEAPEDLSVEGNSVEENSAPGTTAGTITFTDPDDGDDVTYSIADNALFEIEEDTGVISVKDGAVPDHENDDPFAVVVTGSDGILSTTGTVTISITDVNEAPEDFSVEGNSVPENSAPGTAAGTVTFTDADDGDSVTYSIADNALFEIDEDTGVITVKDGAVPDHEDDDPFTVVVTGSDGILSTTGTVTISITDVNEAPEDLSVEGNSVEENSAPGTTAGTITFTDPDDGDDVTYSIADNALFEIDEDTGVISVKDGAVPDHENDDPFAVVVTGSDGILSTTGTVTISITDINEAPEDFSVEGNSVAENSATGTPAGTVTLTDPDDGDDVTYSIADNALFEIDEDTGVITVKDGAIPDHENDDPFAVVVTGSDGILSTTGTVTISITDVNEAPEDFSVEGNSVPENSAPGTAAGTVTFTDPDDGDDVTYSISDNALFEIDEDTGVITVKDGATPDHETDDPFTVVVTGSDGILSTTGTVTISITDINEAPEDFTVEGNSVAENSAPGTAAATVTLTDPDDGDDVTYSISDNALFEIDDDTGVITVKDGAVPDHETDDPFTVAVTGSDGILSTTGTVTISITDINEAPEDFSVEGNSVPENSGPGTPAATVTLTDPDDGDDVTYSIADNALFEIDEDTGIITVKDGAVPDHETDDPFTVAVTGSDGILSTTGTVTISITDVNEAPEDFSVEGNSVPENSAPGTAAGTVTFTDPDDGDDVTYSISDNALFEIDEDTGVITVKDGATPDHETDDPFTVVVTGSDGILSTTGTVTISITDINEAPEDFTVEGNSVAENSAPGTAAATVTLTDPDDGDDVTYSIADNALFEIDDDTGVITVKDGAVPDHETDDTFTVAVTGSDGILSTTGTVTISITDINEAPEDFSVEGNSVAENSGPGTPAATVTFTDPDDGDDVTYSIADNSLFEIDEDTGVISVKDGAIPDHENDDPFTVVVTGSDGILSTTGTVTISITDINEAPEDFSVEGNSVAENSATGTPAGTVSFTDPDDGDDVTYSIANNALFEIDEDTGVITVKDGAAPDHETDDPFTVVVTGSDGILSTTGTVTISITDINEAPEDLTLSDNDVDENSAIGTIVGTVTVSDPDVGDNHEYTLLNDAGGIFEINPTGILSVKDGSTLDFETLPNSYTIEVQATDNGLLSYSEEFTININNLIDERPTDLALTGDMIDEDASDGDTVGSLAVTDPDGSPPDSFTFELTDNAGGRFDVNGDGQIIVLDSDLLDYESNTSHQITVKVTDAAGFTYEETFTIQIGNVIDEAPTDLTLNGDTVAEDALNDTVIGTVSATDPDGSPPDSFTFDLTDDADGRFDIDNSGELTVLDTTLIDFESDTSHQITVEVTDAAGLTYEETFTINITNVVDEAPEDMQLSGNLVAENAPDGEFVGSVSVTDPDGSPPDTFTFELSDDAGGRFAIDDGGNISVLDASLIDFESSPSHEITVLVTDAAGLTYEETFTITVIDVAGAPTGLSLDNDTVAENSANGTLVGTISVLDPDPDTYSFTLTDDAGGRFAINTFGQITVANQSLIDYESATSHSISVEVEDTDGVMISDTYTINILDVNEAPTDLILSGSTILEGSLNGTFIGSLTTIDQDFGDTQSYTLTDNAGGRFALDAAGNLTLLEASLIDINISTSHDITVEVQDSALNTYTETFTITVALTQGKLNDLFIPKSIIAGEDYHGLVSFRLINDSGIDFVREGELIIKLIARPRDGSPDVVLKEIERQMNWDAGESRAFLYNFDLSNLAVGNYVVVAQACYHNTATSESAELIANRDRWNHELPINVGTVPTTDLFGRIRFQSSHQKPRQAGNDLMPLLINIENYGTTDFRRQYIDINIYAEDAMGNRVATPVATLENLFIPYLKPEARMPVWITARIPAGFPPGDYFLAMEIDTAGAVTENNTLGTGESNNVDRTLEMFTVTRGEIDLSGSERSPKTPTFNSSESISDERVIEITNNGNVATQDDALADFRIDIFDSSNLLVRTERIENQLLDRINSGKSNNLTVLLETAALAADNYRAEVTIEPINFIDSELSNNTFSFFFNTI